MTIRILLLIGVLGSIFCFGRSYGQIPYDSACYFPQMGNPQQLDTIYGGEANQGLGKNLSHFPPLKGQISDRHVMQGLPGNIPFITAVKTGPSFNLHKLNFTKKYPYLFANWPTFIAGHFHSSKNIDILTINNDGSSFANATIYWADENGEFDTSRYTQVLPFNSREMPYPYVAKLTSDTVDDIIMSLNDLGTKPDTAYMALIKGGQHLYDQGKIALWDDTAYWAHFPSRPSIDTFQRFPSQGDWRGVGREDLITGDNWGNHFYYKNEPPFDLHRFIHSMIYDTIMSIREWSLHSNFPGFGAMGAIRAFPKNAGDRSFDLIAPLPIYTGKNNGICIFKGGPDFGSKRLNYDSSDFFLHSPAYYSGDFAQDQWPGEIIGCGDLTGTENPVLGTRGGYFTYGFTALYVLGKAMDDKIDVFFSQNEGGFGGADTIHVLKDNRTTYIMGAPAYQTPEDQNIGIFQKGSLQVLYGAENIPVHLNPKFAVVSVQLKDGALEAYPNPATRSLSIVMTSDFGEPIKIILRDVLGRSVYSSERFASGGLETFHLELPSLSSGTYVLEVLRKLNRFTAKISIIQ